MGYFESYCKFMLHRFIMETTILIIITFVFPLCVTGLLAFYVAKSKEVVKQNLFEKRELEEVMEAMTELIDGQENLLKDYRHHL